ncbi:MAG: RsmE family RNA methyltransferase [Clostridia bacterium]
MAKRFIVEEKDLNIQDTSLIFSGDEVKHVHVLRYNIDDEILINEYICRVTGITKKTIECEILKKVSVRGVPNVHISLYQAILKSDKMDYVVQKAVELGIHRVIPFTSKNIVVKLDEKDKIKKVERWNKISKEASKQCARTDVIDVASIIDIKDIEKLTKVYDAVFFAYEAEDKSLKKAIDKIKEEKEKKQKEEKQKEEKQKEENKNEKDKSKNEKAKLSIAIIIGAEGGFTKEEAQCISEMPGVFSVSLGERILRAETASLNLISILMYELDI